MSKQGYFIERYSGDAFTISVDAIIPDHARMYVDLRLSSPRKRAPHLPRSVIQQELFALIDLGADVIDIGTHSDWIAAEIPNELGVQSKDVERVVTLLNAIKMKVLK